MQTNHHFTDTPGFTCTAQATAHFPSIYWHEKNSRYCWSKPFPGRTLVDSRCSSQCTINSIKALKEHFKTASVKCQEIFEHILTLTGFCSWLSMKIWMTFLASQKITAATEIENSTEYNIQNTRIITKSTWRLQTTARAADLRKFLRLVQSQW